jgi:hypothetical protein
LIESNAAPVLVIFGAVENHRSGDFSIQKSESGQGVRLTMVMLFFRKNAKRDYIKRKTSRQGNSGASEAERSNCQQK